MIVDPDFFDHWKTRLLIEELDDPSAPIYVMRLWAHCQHRRKDRFDLSPTALKALCHYHGHPTKLEAVLVSSGFVRREGSDLIVCKWSEYNASLIANWTNGKKGGRPKKPKQNPRVSDAKPMANPSITDRSRSDEIGVDEIGVDETKGGSTPLNPRPPPFHPAFEIFWKTYPATRRQAKPKAYKAWQVAGKRLVAERQITKAEAVAVLQAACEEFAASPVGKSEFCPGPAPWLTQGRYDDDRVAWQRKDTNGKSQTNRRLPYGTTVEPSAGDQPSNAGDRRL